MYFYRLVQRLHFEQEALLTDTNSCKHETSHHGNASPTTVGLLPKQKYDTTTFFSGLSRGISAGSTVG